MLEASWVVLGHLGDVVGRLGDVLDCLGAFLGSWRFGVWVDAGSTRAQRGLNAGSAPAEARARRRWGEGREGGAGKETCVCDLTRRRPEPLRIYIYI